MIYWVNSLRLGVHGQAIFSLPRHRSLCFVCYAHEDSAVVYPELAWLHGQGVNLWYDEGIPAGQNWRAAIGDSLLGADHILFYISRCSLGSDHCNREINLALDEGKEVIPVYLEKVELTSDLKVGLNRVQALRLESNAGHRTMLLGAIGQGQPAELTGSPPKKKNRWMVRASVLGAFVVLAVMGSWFVFNDNDLATHSLPANNLYVRSYTTGDLREKVDLLDKALEYDPSFLDARAELSSALMEAGEVGILEALPAFQRARDEALNVLASDPQHSLATSVLARTYLQLYVSANKALETFVIAESLGYSPSIVAIFKAAIYLNTGNYDLAESTMVAAHKLDPESADVAEFLARCLYLQGEVDAAWAMFDKALKLNPRFKLALSYALQSAAAEKDVERLRS
ncbi:MAG: TIR domain-containing protein, partial [Gammaproteobacteria bacterium]|nr:TIR domain-containing protein [Gammaproteobacteria bacterium]